MSHTRTHIYFINIQQQNFVVLSGGKMKSKEVQFYENI